jgi:hypothetical protein
MKEVSMGFPPVKFINFKKPSKLKAIGKPVRCSELFAFIFLLLHPSELSKCFGKLQLVQLVEPEFM